MKLIEATRINDLELVKKLINEGYPLDEKNNNGSTALIIASIYDHTEIAKELIKAGASLNDIDICGNIAFDFNAFIWQSFDIQDLVLTMHPHLYSHLEENVGIHKDILLKLKMKEILDI